MKAVQLLLVCGSLISASLLVNYKGGDPVSTFGSPQIQKLESDDITSSNDGNAAFIKVGDDPDGKPALHYHRAPSHRRAEVLAKGNYAAGHTYFIGYEFQLSNVHQHLALFQWKKQDKSQQPVQNIPMNLQFTETEPTRLSVGYTKPGAPYSTIWTDPSDFAVNQTHNIALAIETSENGRLRVWLDGQSVLDKSGLALWTGETHPKFGIYRGEKGDHDGSGKHSNVFDLWVSRVQISDASLKEIEESSGLKGNAGT